MVVLSLSLSLSLSLALVLLPAEREYNNSSDSTVLQGPESIATFIAGCRGEEYFEGASAAVGQAVVQMLEAMYKSIHSGKAEAVKLS